MAIRRRTPDTAPDLKPAVIAILLRGWGAEAPEPSEHGFGGGMLELFDSRGAGIIELWTAHADWLRQKAAAWGWLPEWEHDGQRLFYGEYVTRRGTE